MDHWNDVVYSPAGLVARRRSAVSALERSDSSRTEPGRLHERQLAAGLVLAGAPTGEPLDGHCAPYSGGQVLPMWSSRSNLWPATSPISSAH
jgi:hypothetical protein